MPFDLRIHFEFLCAFAPPKPFVDDPAPNECWVVLANLRHLPDLEKRHFPVLVADKRDRVLELAAGEAPRPWDTTWDNPNVPHLTPFRLLDLRGEDISLRPKWPAPLPGQPDPAAPPGLVLDPTIQHLTRIEKAGLGLEVFDESLLDGTPADRIAARMFLDRGELSTEEITPPFDILEERDPPPHEILHENVRIARRVVLAFDGLESFDFAFRALGAGEQDPEQILRLKSPQPANGTVTVKIRNTEKGKIWERELPDYKDEFESEMNLYFRLSAKQDLGPIPKILLKVAGPDVGESGVCAPKTFDRRGLPQ